MPYIVVFSFSVALDAITGEVKLQFVMPSNILFMFSFAKMVFCYTCLQLSLLASSSLCVSLLIMYVSLRVCVSCYSVCVCVYVHASVRLVLSLWLTSVHVCVCMYCMCVCVSSTVVDLYKVVFNPQPVSLGMTS